MKLIDILKNSFFLQNLASWLFSKVPPFVEHNVEKYGALRKAFYLTAIEGLEGDYLEFGVFTGSSFVFACRFGQKMNALNNGNTRYFGYDSFQGFGEPQAHDKHPFYVDDIFAVNSEKVIRNIKRKGGRAETHLIKGFYEETLRDRLPSTLGITKSRIIFIDCDLKDPAALVLRYVRPTLQNGTVLIMDDFFSYRGNPDLGVAGAFNDFQKQYPDITWRRICDYGYGGVAFICSIRPESAISVRVPEASAH